MMITPRVTLEIGHMQQHIVSAFANCQVDLQEMVNAEVLKVCSTDELKHQIESATRQAVQKAIKDSIDTFFLYGEGKKFIKQAAEKRLSEIIDDMGLGETL